MMTYVPCADRKTRKLHLDLKKYLAFKIISHAVISCVTKEKKNMHIYICSMKRLKNRIQSAFTTIF